MSTIVRLPERVGDAILSISASQRMAGEAGGAQVPAGSPGPLTPAGGALFCSSCARGEADGAIRASHSVRADGRTDEACLGKPGRKPAIFIDRDGTLLEPVEYLGDPDGVKLVPGTGEAMRSARSAGFALVVVSNQSGIARGFYGPADVTRVHERVAELLAIEGALIDRFFFCPHHPDFTGPCRCRKPEPGLLLQAAHCLNLDLGRSFLVGDTIEDLQAGARAGCRTILVHTGYGERQARERRAEMPAGSQEAADLAGAIRQILQGREGR
ncbi:MAG: HAD family hydrolase [Candidatus Eisenbacteria bacterium]|nr:HAD family hydrolase [Candidatus Eisenbacteria bacterium]